MNKGAFRHALLAHLTEELASLERAVAAAHEGATHGEAVAEDKYDTRGLEASYLAGAQEARARDLRQVITLYRSLPVREFESGDCIDAFALVRLEADDGALRTYYLGPQGGGVRLEFEGEDILVITPRAALGATLMEQAPGDDVIVDTQNGPRQYKIVALW